MPSLTQVLGDQRTTDLDLGGGFLLRVTYDRTMVTADIDAIAGLAEASEAICDIVSEWDLTGPVPTRDNRRTGKKRGEVVPDGAPVPLEPAVLAGLDIGLLTGVLQLLAIDTAASLDPTKQAKRSRPSSANGTSPR